MKVTLEVGDVVKLKSVGSGSGSGPDMTINSKTGTRGSDEFQYECLWFHDRELRSGLFTHASIKPVGINK